MRYTKLSRLEDEVRKICKAKYVARNYRIEKYMHDNTYKPSLTLGISVSVQLTDNKLIIDITLIPDT